jgi:hypothetical protein
MSTSTEAERGDALEGFLGRAAAKERTKIEKHLAACDAENDSNRGTLWRRLATLLDSFAGSGVESAGGQAWRFFCADGKYRMQVFALEDRGDGALRVALPDVLDEAIKKKVLLKGKVPNEYGLKGSREPLRVEALDNAKYTDPPAHVKSMLGWGRRAIEVTIPTTSEGGPRTDAVEALCEIAAKKFRKA